MTDPVDGLRILMLLEGTFPSMGGAERQLETLATALLARGHGVQVLAPRLHRDQRAGAERCGALDVYRIDYPHLRVLGSLVLLLRLGWLLLRWRGRYDAIHVHIAHHMGAVAAVLGRLLGKPVVLKFSGWWEAERGSLRPQGLGPRLSRLLLRQASAVQAISTRIGRDVEGYGFQPRRVHWLPNAVNPQRFLDLQPAFPEQATLRRAVFVGRLVPEKALDVLLQAWAQALGERPEWRLRLVGDGAEEAALRALAARLGIADRVEFAGRSSAVEQHLVEAEVGLLPSRFEGLSNTLLEYLCAGLPAVASRISGSEDFVRPGETGWLCEPGDVDSLAAALRAMADASPAERAALGAGARRFVLAQAGLDAVVSRLEQLYRGRAPQAT